jgi:NTE family protein
MIPTRQFPMIAAALLLCAARAPAAPAETAHARPVVAVVLSGGAALGFAHIGVLKVIEEAGIPVDIVVGTSMGAIVGGLYAAGYSPGDMERLTGSLDWQAAFDDALTDSPYSFRERGIAQRYSFTVGINGGGFWGDRGLFGAQSITSLLELLTLNVAGVGDFDLLPRRFRAVAADISTGEQVVLDRGSLADAMRASATIPLLFKPFLLDGRPLVDGGIVNRLPTDVARAMGADIVIAVDVGESKAQAPGGIRSMVDMLGQVSKVLLEQNSAERRALADLVIEPDLSGFQRTDFFRAMAIVRRGEEEARGYKAQLLAIAEKVGATRALNPQVDRAPQYPGPSSAPVASDLLIQDASPENSQVLRRIFLPLLHVPLGAGLLRAAMNDAYQSGRFEEVRVGMSPGTDGFLLEVSTVPVAPPRAAALLGVSYEGDLSQTQVNSLVISPGIMVRDLTGKGSQFIVDTHLVDTLGASIEYFQPLGGGFFVDGYGSWQLDKDIFLQNDSAQVGRVEQGPLAGAWTGFLLGHVGEVKGGLAWSGSHYVDLSHPVAVDSTDSVARFLLTVDTRPARVFAARGFGFGIGYDQALPALGGSEKYRKLSFDAAAAIPLVRSLTLGLTLSGGTDFTSTSSAPGVLGPSEAFSIRTDSEFRGYQEWEVRGSHKLAAGLDLQLRLPTITPIIGTDLFLLGNLSAGNCWTDFPAAAADRTLRYGASVGLGARIQNNFAVVTRVCAVDTGRVQLSVDIGSFTVNDVAGPLQ